MFSAKGLSNGTGANNCFLNVILQSLWHTTAFREGALACPHARCTNDSEENPTEYAPWGKPQQKQPHKDTACLLCCLRGIFKGLEDTSSSQPVRPDAVRHVLATLSEQYTSGRMVRSAPCAFDRDGTALAL
eukprot:TRINITY_DN2647_c0_g3_i1.p2 TRINITY_DN2647_c0_g3~~TRINITY_DN2647_c0_g3_i1.p2  ORF type:complete len:131 (-),score=23.13 TRINITY_DN2647_c0_g3_i1:40-432(-)